MKTLLVSFIFIFFLISFSNGQVSNNKNLNPFFDIINQDNNGKMLPVKLLLNKKVNHNSQYETLYKYDFDKNGKLDELFYSFGSQGFARFYLKTDGNVEAVTLYDDYFDIPEQNEGFWLYITDVYGDQTPEILIFSQISEKSFLKIFHYSSSKYSYTEHTYQLNETALSKNLLILNQKKIFVPIGSQGLFEEYPLIID